MWKIKNPSTNEVEPRSSISQEWCSDIKVTFTQQAPSHRDFRFSESKAETSPSYAFQRGCILFTTKPKSLAESSSYIVEHRKRQISMTNYSKVLGGDANPEQSMSHDAFPSRHRKIPSLQCFTDSEKVSSPPYFCEVCQENIGSQSGSFTSHFCAKVPDKSSVIKYTSPYLTKQSDDSTPVAQCEDASFSNLKTNQTINEDAKSSFSNLRKFNSRYCEALSSPHLTKQSDNSAPVSQCEDTSSFSNLKSNETINKDAKSRFSKSPKSDSRYCKTLSSDSAVSSSGSCQTIFEKKKRSISNSSAINAGSCSSMKRESSSLSGCLSNSGMHISNNFSKMFLFDSKVNSSSISSCASLSENSESAANCPAYLTDSSKSICSLDTSDFHSKSSARSDVSRNSSSEEFYASKSDVSSWKTSSDLGSSTHSNASLVQCDSFDYANSADIIRMKEKEKEWSDSKTWKSIGAERAIFLKKLYGCASDVSAEFDSSDDSDCDSGSELAWTFGSSSDVSQTSDCSLIEQSSKLSLSNTVNNDLSFENSTFSNGCDNPSARNPNCYDIGPSQASSSSDMSSFSSDASQISDQSKMTMFGPTVKSLRKPGHHVGPSKNPECSCKNCLQHFEEIQQMSASLIKQ